MFDPPQIDGHHAAVVLFIWCGIVATASNIVGVAVRRLKYRKGQ